VFFSQERAQPALPLPKELFLILRRSQVPGHGLQADTGAEHKSLLLLFFRKEGLSCLSYIPPG
jgi:hypothetical protein